MSEISNYQPIETLERLSMQPCVERWRMMRPYLDAFTPPSDGRPRLHTAEALDIGCHTGWFCRMFARLGWRAVGIDKSVDWLNTAIDLNKIALEKRFLINEPQYILGNVLEIELPRPDVALLLSTAMYLFDDVDAGWNFMRRLSDAAPALFLDFGGQYANRLPFDESSVEAEMLGRTSYTSVKFLGRTDFENRPFYVLMR